MRTDETLEAGEAAHAWKYIHTFSLLRSRPECNSGTTHENVSPNGFHELFLEYVYVIVKFWVYDVTENVNQRKMKSLETFNQWMIRRWNQQLSGMPMQSS